MMHILEHCNLATLNEACFMSSTSAVLCYVTQRLYLVAYFFVISCVKRSQ